MNKNIENLYHYTNVEGFKSIIENHYFRLSESSFLNDPDDCKLFNDFLVKNIDCPKKLIVSSGVKKLIDYENEILEIYKKCSFEDYVKYLEKHIKLYVMSFSSVADYLTMWNYYGKGGFSLEISKDQLIQVMKNTLKENDEYFTISNVIYSEKDKCAPIPNFNNFHLFSKKSNDLLKENEKNRKEKANKEDIKNLFEENDLETFIYIYYKGYLLSLEYLLESKEISIEDDQETICKAVFKNTKDFEIKNRNMLWKRDLSLFMILLSSLIKSNSYESENEIRIVYFKYDNENKENENIDYYIKHTPFGNLLSPYISLKGSNEEFNDIIEKIIISPATKNLPININMYKNTLKEYLLSKKYYKSSKSISYSKHNIRW